MNSNLLFICRSHAVHKKICCSQTKAGGFFNHSHPSQSARLSSMRKTAYSELNSDQRLLVDNYVDGAVSMADAVRAAGFAHFEGMTEHDVAQRMLGAPKIQAAIRERMALVQDKGVAGAMWLLRRLVDYANADYTDIYSADGALLPPKQWPLALRRMIRKVKVDTNSGIISEITFEPKTKILELIGRTDLVSAFTQENEANETVVIVRDYTRKIEVANEAVVIEAEASERVGERVSASEASHIESD